MLRRQVTWSLPIVLLLTACSAFAPTRPGLPKDPFEAANRKLRHRVAAIELSDGSTVPHGENLRMDAHETSWITDGAERTVDTQTIVRIQVLPERKPLRRLAQGLTLGAAVGGVGVLTSSGGSEGGSFGSDGDDSALDAAFVSGAILVGGAVGLIYGLARPLPGEVVFEATASPANLRKP
jgi:hypothetical protein